MPKERYQTNSFYSTRTNYAIMLPTKFYWSSLHSPTHVLLRLKLHRIWAFQIGTNGLGQLLIVQNLQSIQDLSNYCVSSTSMPPSTMVLFIACYHSILSQSIHQSPAKALSVSLPAVTTPFVIFSIHITKDTVTPWSGYSIQSISNSVYRGFPEQTHSNSHAKSIHPSIKEELDLTISRPFASWGFQQRGFVLHQSSPRMQNRIPEAPIWPRKRCNINSEVIKEM